MMQTNGAGKPLGEQNLMFGPASTSGTGSAATSTGTGSAKKDSNAAPHGASLSGVVMACVVGVSTLAGVMLVL